MIFNTRKPATGLVQMRDSHRGHVANGLAVVKLQHTSSLQLLDTGKFKVHFFYFLHPQMICSSPDNSVIPTCQWRNWVNGGTV